MLGLRFAKLIEQHSKALAEELVRKLNTSERTQAFRHIPDYELRDDVQDLYQHLSDWLATKTEMDVRKREFKIGHYRARQHVPVEQFLWALILSKEVIFEFLQREAVAEGPFELIQQLDFLRTLDNFFDRAMYHAICGFAQPLQPEDDDVRRGVLGLPT
jgi:hypothetical protein